MTDLCLMTVAQGIPDRVKERFETCARLSKPTCSFDVVFLSEPTSAKYVFSKSRIMNAGLRQLFKQDYAVIAQVDIDLIIPPGLLDKAVEIGSEPMRMFHNHHRRYEPVRWPWIPDFPEGYDKMDWERGFNEIVPENADGAFNAGTPETWRKSWGFNELMQRWGWEDVAFRRTANSRGVRFTNYNKFCLLHVNHPARQTNVSKFNREMQKKLLDEGGRDWFADV